MKTNLVGNSFTPQTTSDKCPLSGFTLIELLVVITTIAILAALLLPALGNGSMQDQAIQCMNNCNRLAKAWTMYASDNNDRCVNNYGIAQTDAVEGRGNSTWALDSMDWTTASQNTNITLLQMGLLGPYLAKSVSAYKCPADNYLSGVQVAAGFQDRVRSYSMNCFLGYFSPCPDCLDGIPGSGQDVTYLGKNFANPSWPQYLKLGSIPQPSQIFVFVDEHPNSINDGYFDPGQGTPSAPAPWEDVPASYHNGAGGFSFADGHSEMHKWLVASTIFPVKPGQNLQEPTLGNPPNYTDLIWLWAHACVK